MNTNNDVTGDRITNALKGDKDKYREGWDKIFGNKKKETSVLDDLERVSREMDKQNVYTDYEEQYKILDELTQDNDRMSKDSDIDMGLYNDQN